MENRYPGRHKIELDKAGKRLHKGDLIITHWQSDGSMATNSQITLESFLVFLRTHYAKELGIKHMSEETK